MHAQSRTFVVHRTPTRIRIKIPNRRKQQAYFESLERVLHQHSDVLQVHSNPLTAGVIIECRKDFELTVQHRRFLGLEMEPDGILLANSWSGCDSRQNEGMKVSPGALTFAALILKLVVAITTRQTGVQLIEWIIDACVQAAQREAQGRAARQRALLVAPSE